MKFWKILSVAIALVLSVSANAALIGDTVYAQHSYSNGQTFFNSSEIIWNCIEFVYSSYPAPLFELDFFGQYLEIQHQHYLPYQYNF